LDYLEDLTRDLHKPLFLLRPLALNQGFAAFGPRLHLCKPRNLLPKARPQDDRNDPHPGISMPLKQTTYFCVQDEIRRKKICGNEQNRYLRFEQGAIDLTSPILSSSYLVIHPYLEESLALDYP
jgi:hypothetical protein